MRPLADGGEGAVDALSNGLGGKIVEITVSGPLLKPVNAKYCILQDNFTAVIEMASASGITLLSSEERNPLLTTTCGVGEIIKDAIRRGCRHFIVGIGGSVTNDFVVLISILANFAPEFLFCKFVVYRGKKDTLI